MRAAIEYFGPEGLTALTFVPQHAKGKHIDITSMDGVAHCWTTSLLRNTSMVHAKGDSHGGLKPRRCELCGLNEVP